MRIGVQGQYDLYTGFKAREAIGRIPEVPAAEQVGKDVDENVKPVSKEVINEDVLRKGNGDVGEIALRLKKIWNKDLNNRFAIVFLTSKNKKATVDIYSDYNSDLTKAENKKYRLYGFKIDYTDMVEGTHQFYLERNIDSYKTIMCITSEY